MNYAQEILQTPICECRLCGMQGGRYTDILTVGDDSLEEFIKIHLRVSLRDSQELPSTVCDNCLDTVHKWRNLLSVSQNVQNHFNERLLASREKDGLAGTERTKLVKKRRVQRLKETEEIGDSEPALVKNDGKKSRFTLEYLKAKIGRELNLEEEGELLRLIANGDDRGIYGFLLGSGSNQIWPCQTCPEQIKGTVRDVTKHYETKHQTSPLFPCHLCGKVIRSIHTYKRHRISHLSEYKCTDCDKVFVDRSKLIMHRTTHSNERPYVCTFCDKRFKMNSHLKAHTARAHAGEPEKLPFACEICGKQFAFKGNLTTHVQTTHSDNRPYVCHVCGKGLKYKQALTLHLNSHAGIKLFSCSICEASFTTRASMAAHMRRHTGERPYICSECGKGFISSSARSSHKQHVHATCRKFTCKVCGKSFKVLRDLKVHSSLHSGEKRHVCTTCGRAFRAAANLYSHRKIHRRAEEKQELGGKLNVVGTLDAAVAEIGEYMKQGQVGDQQSLMDLGAEDPLSQVIREHLSHSLVGEDPNLATLHETQSYVLGHGMGQQEIHGQQASLEQATLMEYVSPDNVEYHNLSTNEQTSGFLKEILLAQNFDK